MASPQLFGDLVAHSRSSFVKRSGRNITLGIFRYAKGLESIMRANGVVPTAVPTEGFSNIILNTTGSGISLKGIKVNGERADILVRSNQIYLCEAITYTCVSHLLSAGRDDVQDVTL